MSYAHPTTEEFRALEYVLLDSRDYFLGFVMRQEIDKLERDWGRELTPLEIAALRQTWTGVSYLDAGDDPVVDKLRALGRGW